MNPLKGLKNMEHYKKFNVDILRIDMYERYKEIDRNNPYEDGTGKITNVGNVPFENPNYNVSGESGSESKDDLNYH